MVRRSNKAIRFNINWNIVSHYNNVKNPNTSMLSLVHVVGQAEILEKWVSHFRYIVTYFNWKVKITQQNNLVAL